MVHTGQSVAALLLATLTIAALHALIPSHWLAFAVVGRSQRWTLRRTLTTTFLAGSGHILLTIVLGILLAVVGKGLLVAIPAWAEHGATAFALIGLGLWFAIPNLRRDRKGCCHHGHQHHKNQQYEQATETSTKASASGESSAEGSALNAMRVLITGMTLSPCLDLLSVYVGAAGLPWHILALISLLMAATTLGLMLLLVWLTLRGIERLNWRWLERNEGLVVGGVLVALGVLLLCLR